MTRCPIYDPALGAPQVLEGFDASGAPRLRPARRPITLQHLLTHTAGFSYEQWDANTSRYVKATNMPSTSTGKVASLRMPLAFDPGERWEYGVNIDWVGLLVEATSGQKLDVYFRENIFAPLGMKDTGFATTPEQRARQVTVHQRQADGSLAPQPLETPFTPEFFAGGGGLYSTAADIHDLPASAAAWGRLQRRAHPAARDCGSHGPEPHRRYRGGDPEDDGSAPLRRCQLLPWRQLKIGASPT